MNKFIDELPALIIVLAMLIMATVLIVTGHATFAEEAATLLAPAFWFLRNAFMFIPPSASQSLAPAPPLTPVQETKPASVPALPSPASVPPQGGSVIAPPQPEAHTETIPQ